MASATPANREKLQCAREGRSGKRREATRIVVAKYQRDQNRGGEKEKEPVNERRRIPGRVAEGREGKGESSKPREGENDSELVS